MTAADVFSSALDLAGYGRVEFEQTTEISSKLLSIVNAVYAELFFLEKRNNFVPLSNPQQTLNLTETALNDCIVYGVAALIQNILSDAQDYEMFEEIYSLKKRNLVKSCNVTQIQDTFVRGCDF